MICKPSSLHLHPPNTEKCLQSCGPDLHRENMCLWYVDYTSTSALQTSLHMAMNIHAHLQHATQAHIIPLPITVFWDNIHLLCFPVWDRFLEKTLTSNRRPPAWPGRPPPQDWMLSSARHAREKGAYPQSCPCMWCRCIASFCAQ